MILLVSGTPASGKSTYCRWLEQEHGFMHFDIDAQMFQGTGVELAWNSIFQPGGTVQPFSRTVRQWLRSLAIDWGFPPDLLGVVRDLKDEGIDIRDTDAISKKYVGKPYPYRYEVPITLVIEIDKARLKRSLSSTSRSLPDSTSCQRPNHDSARLLLSPSLSHPMYVKR